MKGNGDVGDADFEKLTAEYTSQREVTLQRIKVIRNDVKSERQKFATRLSIIKLRNFRYNQYYRPGDWVPRILPAPGSLRGCALD